MLSPLCGGPLLRRGHPFGVVVNGLMNLVLQRRDLRGKGVDLLTLSIQMINFIEDSFQRLV